MGLQGCGFEMVVFSGSEEHRASADQGVLNGVYVCVRARATDRKTKTDRGG